MRPPLSCCSASVRTIMGGFDGRIVHSRGQHQDYWVKRADLARKAICRAAGAGGGAGTWRLADQMSAGSIILRLSPIWKTLWPGQKPTHPVMRGSISSWRN